MPDLTLAIDLADLRKLQQLLQAIAKRQVRLIVAGSPIDPDLYDTAQRWAAICKTRIDAAEKGQL